MSETIEARPTCARCERPERLCYCAHVVPQRTRTRVVLLQHPRESGLAIGTAHMARLCLPDAELHVGMAFSSERLASILDDATRPAALLWPGPGSIDLARDPPKDPITLVVIDGTWPQAKSLVRKSPALAALPRYAFAAATPSTYRIRREPKAEYLSTIESLAYVLGLLEGAPDRFASMQAPFTAMVDAQLAFANGDPSPRRRTRRVPRVPAPPTPPPIFAERSSDLVCMIAESNAWPLASGRQRRGDPGEPLHIVAVRGVAVRGVAVREVADRETDTLDLLIAPRTELAPGTPGQLAISLEALTRGIEREAAAQALAAFLRPSDVLVTWGEHTARVLEAAGLPLPSERLDLRRQARIHASRRVGPIEDFAAQLGVSPVPVGRGRAGARVGVMHAIAQHFAERTS